MRIFQSILFLAFFLIFITVLAVMGPVQADDRPGYFFTDPFFGLGPAKDYRIPPYFNDGVLPNRAGEQVEAWSPARWIARESDPERLIQRFYDTHLVTDQDMDDDVPVLEVGDLFLRLSDRDKRRVLQVFDYTYRVTAGENPMFIIIEHDRTNKVLGTFGVTGLQLN